MLRCSSVIIIVVYIYGHTVPSGNTYSKWALLKATTSDVFGSEIDVCATCRKREIVVGQAEEELWNTWFHERRLALLHRYKQQCS